MISDTSPENFGRYFYFSIREQNEIFSATGNGRIPWLSIDDLAKLAFDALTAEKSLNKDSFVFGPELYTYEEVCYFEHPKTCDEGANVNKI